ncbi:IS3 family transposase [Paenibacillus polymyxa]|nr:IS3 family transposase [Paenibacillus polymyxa]
MVEKIRKLCIQHKYRYGYRKITALLRWEYTVKGCDVV